MDTLTIAELRASAQQAAHEAVLHAQVESSALKSTRDGKPYRELILADATGHMTLRVWSDHPCFESVESTGAGSPVALEGEFSVSPAFGLEARRWQLRPLTDEEFAAVLEGPSDLRQKQAADFALIESIIAQIADPRLNALASLFLADYGERFRRTSAARAYHHARRGGLVEHVAQMLRTADALASLYPELNRSLLLAGTLFHDAGKLWENCAEERGFAMPYTERGELLGHIPIGIELANNLWRKLATPEQLAAWSSLQPASEDVRLHLLHLIAAHHGGLEFGSPVVPKTPEAWALHYVDNLDAKMEMFREGYRSASALAARVFERVRPLPGNLVSPLAHFENDPSPDVAPPIEP